MKELEFKNKIVKERCGCLKGISYVTQKILFENERYAVISRKSEGFTGGEYTLIIDKKINKKISEFIGSFKIEDVAKRVNNKLAKLGYFE